MEVSEGAHSYLQGRHFNRVDFYSSLRGLLEQIPKGCVARLSDIGEALGDRAATVALPTALFKLYPKCQSAAKAVRADGSIVVKEGVNVLRGEGIDVRGLSIVDIEYRSFREFKGKPFLEGLRREQERIAKRIVLKNSIRKPKKVVGLDLAYDGDEAYAAAILMDATTFKIEKEIAIKIDINFPYVPSYLAFRELPGLLRTLTFLRLKPDILFVDGHGILHPAGCGIAAHLGVKTKVPTIGIGKSLLVGEVEKSSLKVHEASPVRIGGRVRGYALRSSVSKRPIYISPGNYITPRIALNVTRDLCRHRIPEPIRQSHTLAVKMKRNKKNLRKVPV